MELEKKIKTKQAKIGIVGLGYVGLPFAVEFAKKGFATTGIDIDAKKVAAVNKASNYIRDIADE